MMLQGKGVTAAQLVKDQIAQQLIVRRDRARKYSLNKRKEDAIFSQNPLRSALDIFELHFVHNYPVQFRSIPQVIGQEPSDDVHQELVMPFTENFVESSQDFLETKITSVAFEDKSRAQIENLTSPPRFLSPSTFLNFNNLGGNMRVQTVNGIPEINGGAGGAGDRASHTSPVVQSHPSHHVQSHPSHHVQFHPSPYVQSVPSAAVQSDFSALG